MAVSQKPVVGEVLTVATAGTAQAPTLQPPDNCHTMLVYNPAATSAFISFVPNAAAFAASNFATIPATSLRTYVIGTKSKRVVSGDPSVGADRLFFDVAVNGTSVQITYICGLES
jgi:hypothetical protein